MTLAQPRCKVLSLLLVASSICFEHSRYGSAGECHRRCSLLRWQRWPISQVHASIFWPPLSLTIFFRPATTALPHSSPVPTSLTAAAAAINDERQSSRVLLRPLTFFTVFEQKQHEMNALRERFGERPGRPEQPPFSPPVQATPGPRGLIHPPTLLRRIRRSFKSRSA